MVIYMHTVAQTLNLSQLIRVSGRLETGLKMDEKTAFVSLIRIVEAKWTQI